MVSRRPPLAKGHFEVSITDIDEAMMCRPWLPNKRTFVLPSLGIPLRCARGRESITPRFYSAHTRQAPTSMHQRTIRIQNMINRVLIFCSATLGRYGRPLLCRYQLRQVYSSNGAAHLISPQDLRLPLRSCSLRLRSLARFD
jgi:hypothetical protein